MKFCFGLDDMPKSQHLPGKEKHTPKRTPVMRQRDMADIARLISMNYTHAEIAAWLTANRPYSLTRTAVQYDLEQLKKLWNNDAMESIERMRVKELMKLNRLEREAWEAWERSQKEKQRTEQEMSGTLGEEGMKPNRARLIREQISGEAAYLVIVKECIALRAKIFGLFAPTKIAGMIGTVPPLSIASDESQERVVFYLPQEERLIGNGHTDNGETSSNGD